MVNILQFIVFFYLIKVRLAAHATVFLEQLKTIALGEFVPYDWIKVKAQAMFPDSFNRVDDISFIEKQGSVFIVAIVLILLTAAVLLLNKYNTKFSEAKIKLAN